MLATLMHMYIYLLIICYPNLLFLGLSPGCPNLLFFTGCPNLLFLTGCPNLLLLTGCPNLLFLNGCPNLLFLTSCPNLLFLTGCPNLLFVQIFCSSHSCRLSHRLSKFGIPHWFSNFLSPLVVQMHYKI